MKPIFPLLTLVALGASCAPAQVPAPVIKTSVPDSNTKPALSLEDLKLLPNTVAVSVPGLPPARPVFQKGSFSMVGIIGYFDEFAPPQAQTALYPNGDRNFGELNWVSRIGYGVREAQLRLGLDLLPGKAKPKLLSYDAEIGWLLCPSEWGQMVVDANKALEANPNDGFALAKRAAGWRYSYRLDLLPTYAQAVDAGSQLNSDLSKSDLEAMFKLPPVREAMPYVLAALRVKQFAPSADDLQGRKVSRIKTTLDALQNLNAAYAFFSPVAPEAVEGRVALYGQTALAMRLNGDPNAPKQAQTVESITAQVLAQKPKSALALWRFVAANPDAKPDEAKTVFAGIGDKNAGADTAARIAQTFWSVPGQFKPGAAWANFAFEMAGPSASPLVKWVKAQATSAGAVRFPVAPEVAFGLSLFEADKVEALELLAQNAGERSELTLARRALEEAIVAGAPPRFWMLLSRAAEAEANSKTGLEAEDLWVEALNANRIGTRYQMAGDERLASEIEPDSKTAPDGLTANTDKPGELDPLPARYAEPSPIVAARLHGAWLLEHTSRIGGGWGSSEISGTLENNASKTVEKDGNRRYELTLGAQSAIALHRRFMRAQIARTPDIEETSRGTTVPIKFNRKKVLEKYLADLIKTSEKRANNR